MKDYLIEDIKLGVDEGTLPFTGCVVVSMKVNDGLSSRWLHAMDFGGAVMYIASDEDINHRLATDDSDETVELANRLMINEFGGVNLEGYECQIENPEKDSTVDLFNYLVLLLKCSMEEYEDYARLGKGRHIGEFEIPEPED